MRKYDKNIRKKVNKNNKKLKVIEINLSALIMVSVIISIIFILFLGHQISTVGTKVVINLVEEVTSEETVDGNDTWKITTVSESEENTDETVATSSNTDISDYKATDDLTEEDKEDEYQKNYQETAVDNDNYLIKTAEWTDKENGEALITIEGSLTVEQETTALYVTTICYGHGLTQSIIVENILYLAEHYDNVDFLVISYNPDSEYNWYDVVTYELSSEYDQEEVDTLETEIKTYLKTCKSAISNKNGGHYTYTFVPAMEEYLFGGFGDSYVSEDNMINKPIAIYVSFDGFYNVNVCGPVSLSEDGLGFDDTWAVEYGSETFFGFLSEYFGNSYMTMSVPDSNSEDFLTIFYYNEYGEFSYDYLNVLLGLMEPENYGLASTVITDDMLEYYNTKEISWLESGDGAQYGYYKIADLPEYRCRLLLCRNL